MALKLDERYPGRANPPSLDYPQGSFKNRTSPDSKDGTYLEKDWANDIQGYLQSLLQDAGIVANGQVDKVGASQYFNALKTVIASESPKTEFATQAEFDAHTSNDKAVSPFVMQPSTQGSATLTGSNNVVAMAGIVTNLGLEKGDVIQIKIASPAYDKLHTVESITNDGQIVVNYEHCGSRGNGPLKLVDYTGVVTIKRIAKWYNASNGLGQDWVNVLPFRVKDVDSINDTGRSIEVNASLIGGAGIPMIKTSSGAIIRGTGLVTGGTNAVYASIGRGVGYRVGYETSSATLSAFWERR